MRYQESSRPWSPILQSCQILMKNIAAAMTQAGRFADLRDPWVASGAAFASEMEHLFLHGPSDKSVIMTSRLHDTMKNIDECLEAFSVGPCILICILVVSSSGVQVGPLGRTSLPETSPALGFYLARPLAVTAGYVITSRILAYAFFKLGAGTPRMRLSRRVSGSAV